MMKRITLALSLAVGLLCASQAQVMMLFSQDSLTGIVSPLDVDSLFYWFAADVGVTDSLGGAIATDEGVGTWNDLSGNGHHVTQSTNGARPVYKATGGPGSKPCIQFDGTNDFLASAAHWWGSDDLTVFVVMKFGNATRDAVESFLYRFQTTRQWTFLASNAANNYLLQMTGWQSNILSRTDTAHFFKHADFRLHFMSLSQPAEDWDLFTNGQSVNTAILTNPVGAGIQDGSTPLHVGAATGDGVTYVNHSSIFISEIIVYSRALSSTERTAIENYLNRKYDLY